MDDSALLNWCGQFLRPTRAAQAPPFNAVRGMTSRRRLLVSILGVTAPVFGFECVTGYSAHSDKDALLPIMECEVAALPERFTLEVPIDAEGRGTIALRHIQTNYSCIFQFSGDVTLGFGQPYDQSVVRLSEGGSLLIENEDELGSQDAVIVTASHRGKSSEASIALDVLTRVVETNVYPNLGNRRWRHWIDSTVDRTTPGTATAALVSHVGDRWAGREVLALGVESGSEPLFLTRHGASVTAVDGTPHAAAVSCLRHADCGRLERISGAMPCLLEELPEELGTFDAVTGGPIFPFLAPDCFEAVMECRILPRVSASGYFAGIFFGPEHEWSDRDDMTFITAEEVRDLLERNGFDIVQLDESQRREVVSKDSIRWHEVAVVAQRRPRSSPFACREETRRDAGLDSSVLL